MRILIDTDVFLDFALGRAPFAAAAQKVIAWAESNPGDASIAWHSLSNIAYLAPSEAREFLSELLRFIEVPAVRTVDAVQALQFAMRDIEDALQAASALAFKANYIISRNTRDYRQSPVPAITPKEFSLKLSRE